MPLCAFDNTPAKVPVMLCAKTLDRYNSIVKILGKPTDIFSVYPQLSAPRFVLVAPVDAQDARFVVSAGAVHVHGVLL